MNNFICSFCSKTFKTRQQFERHNNKKYKCSDKITEIQEYKLNNYLETIKNIKDDIESNDCPICNNNINDIYTTHIESCKNNNNLKLEINELKINIENITKELNNFKLLFQVKYKYKNPKDLENFKFYKPLNNTTAPTILEKIHHLLSQNNIEKIFTKSITYLINIIYFNNDIPQYNNIHMRSKDKIFIVQNKIWKVKDYSRKKDKILSSLGRELLFLYNNYILTNKIHVSKETKQSIISRIDKMLYLNIDKYNIMDFTCSRDIFINEVKSSLYNKYREFKINIHNNIDI